MAVDITIQGDGLLFKKTINSHKAGQIIAFLGADEESVVTDLKQTDNSPLALTPPSLSSPSELINESKAKTNAQKITIIGNYLQKKDGQDSFLDKEVLLQLRKIGEQPGNFSRDVDTAESLQYIYPINVKEGRYGVSAKGVKAIENKFSETPRLKSKSNNKGGFKKAIPPRSEVLSLPIVASLDGYVDFHSIQVKADCILWILAYADKQGIKSLTPREVESLSDKLRRKIVQTGFSAHNKRNIKSGYVSQTNNQFKLEQKGFAHLIDLSAKQPNDKKE